MPEKFRPGVFQARCELIQKTIDLNRGLEYSKKFAEVAYLMIMILHQGPYDYCFTGGLV
jgi:hypothetical protein